MKELGHPPFIKPQLEYEPLDTRQVSQSLLDDYIRTEADRTSSNTNWPVVYDAIEPSPMYDGENAKFGPYMDEKDSIELPNPSEQGSGTINEPYQRRYYFNPQNLPYSLEQSHSYG
jgi:hypothetical protein